MNNWPPLADPGAARAEPDGHRHSATATSSGRATVESDPSTTFSFRTSTKRRGRPLSDPCRTVVETCSAALIRHTFEALVVLFGCERHGASFVTRTRSEYRLSPLAVESPSIERVTRRVLGSDRDVLAALMLDAYQGTIDDEGEDVEDALAAVDRYMTGLVAAHSFVVTEDSRVVAMAFITVGGGVHYVDPIVVAADRKRTGLGRDAVRIVLDSLLTAGIAEVGATITDGNTASERLFLGLGFTRRGPWS